MMVQVLWTLCFIPAQECTVDINIMVQDNYTTMSLLLHGKKSSLKNTKHINVRYLFVTGVINRGDMSVEYCPTEEVWSEVLTKPL